MGTKTRFSEFLNNFIEINILLIIFCLPFSKTILELCAALTIAAYIIKKVFVERRLAPDIEKNVVTALVMFAFFNVLSITNTLYFEQSIVAIFSKVFKWCLLFLAAAETMRGESRFRRLLTVMLFSCALILADAFCQQYITGKDFLHYPSGYPVFKFHAKAVGATTFPTASFPFPNDFSAWMLIYFFTFFVLSLLGKKLKPVLRISAGILTVLLSYFLFLANTRGAYIGIAAAFFVLLVLNFRKLFRYIIIGIFIALLSVTFNPYVQKRIKDTVDLRLSINDRVGMWSAGIEIIKQHPFIGNGVNTFFNNYKEFRQDEDKGKHGSYAHNCYLQMAADIGIFGLISFLFFVFFVVSGNIKKALVFISEDRAIFVLGMSLGLAAFLVHSALDTNLYSLNLAGLFWVSMGCAQGLGKR